MKATRMGIAAGAMLLLAATGCSKFKSLRTLDMGPFAENTVAMLPPAIDLGAIAGSSVKKATKAALP
jgi:hypothetical protein